MNRLKLWVYAVLVIGLAATTLHLWTARLRDQAIGSLDTRLDAASAQLASAERALAGEVTAVAGAAARDPRLAAAVDGPPIDPRRRGVAPPADPSAEGSIAEAASAAVDGAEAELGMALPGRVAIAVGLAGLEHPPAEAGVEALALLKDAVDGKARRGWAHLQGKLAYGAAVRAGERGALLLLVPVDATWASAAAAGTQTTLLVSAPGMKPFGSGRAAEADGLMRAAERLGESASAGRLAPVDITLAGVKLPPVKAIGLDLPADRVLAVPLKGVKDGRIVLAASARPLLAPIVQMQWEAIGWAAVALLLALLFGLLVKPTEIAASVPPALVEAASKIERGDFGARAPALAGKVGTVAAALNRAAEAAEAGKGEVAAGKGEAAAAQDFFAQSAAPAEPPDPFGRSAPPRSERAEPLPEEKVARESARVDGAGSAGVAALSGAAFEAAPVPVPRLATSPEPSAAPIGAPAATAPDPVQAAAGAAGTAGGSEEEQWREVFRDFVRARQECGESAEGLTFERFRQKLESNKATLVSKYSCRTVRFQVYVKEGKAALKARPVR